MVRCGERRRHGYRQGDGGGREDQIFGMGGNVVEKMMDFPIKGAARSFNLADTRFRSFVAIASNVGSLLSVYTAYV
jgi:hypothetical protein